MCGVGGHISDASTGRANAPIIVPVFVQLQSENMTGVLAEG
jgi:hypothetical protein